MTKLHTEESVPYKDHLYMILHDHKIVLSLGKILGHDKFISVLHYPGLETEMHLRFLQNLLVSRIDKSVEFVGSESDLLDDLIDQRGYEQTFIPDMISKMKNEKYWSTGLTPREIDP